MLREIAQGTVQVAALGYFNGRGADGLGAPQNLGRREQAAHALLRML